MQTLRIPEVHSFYLFILRQPWKASIDQVGFKLTEIQLPLTFQCWLGSEVCHRPRQAFKFYLTGRFVFSEKHISPMSLALDAKGLLHCVTNL